MLGRYAGPAEVGIYNISVVLATMLTLPFIALGFVFMPIAGEMFVKRQLPELKRTYQVLTKWIFVASLPLFFIFFFFPEMTIKFLFGIRFLDSALPLRILSLGFLLQTLMGTSVVLMMVTGLSKEIRNISIFGTLLNLALNYMLIKRLNLGLVGASMATMFSYVTISAINLVVLHRRYGIKPFTFRYIRPVLGSMVMGLIIYIIAKALPLYLWMLPLYLILFMAGYLLSLILLHGLDQEDIFMFELISEKAGLAILPLQKFFHYLLIKGKF
jgi:O-antigen/teichoic acid export membrane protein